jgi:hypothetical protein
MAQCRVGRNWQDLPARAPLIGERVLGGLRALDFGQHPIFFSEKFISPPLSIFESYNLCTCITCSR